MRWCSAKWVPDTWLGGPALTRGGVQYPGDDCADRLGLVIDPHLLEKGERTAQCHVALSGASSRAERVALRASSR